MENQVLVPSKGKSFLLVSESGRQEFWGSKHPPKSAQAQVVEYLQTLRGQDVRLLGIMGGPGQNIFVRAASDLGISVWRIPWYRLEELAGLEAKASPTERASAIRQAWEQNSSAFYQLEALEPTIMLLRELTRVRLSIQENFRKPANLQYQSAWRELEVLLPEGEELISLRTFFSNPGFISGAKKDEEELERRIAPLVKEHPLWPYLHPNRDSVLPSVKGLGPSLGGSIISEIGDIRRFPTRKSLRAYVRFHLNAEGEFPKRKAGEISAWNRYLNRAVHWWSSDQMPRYEHPWRLLYDWKKAREMQAHPKVVAREMVTKRGQKRTVYDYSLKHLDLRAKRWVGSQFLNYLWDLWQQMVQAGDLELWYSNSSWPAYFSRIERELKDDLRAYLETEIANRRRREPEEELEENEKTGTV